MNYGKGIRLSFRTAKGFRIICLEWKIMDFDGPVKVVCPYNIEITIAANTKGFSIKLSCWF
jgi:hypothetical protein